MANEAAVCLTAKMYEIRKTIKRLLGDNYSLRIAQWQTVIKAKARKDHNGSELQAMMKLAESADTDIGKLCCIAAYVELAEPSI